MLGISPILVSKYFSFGVIKSGKIAGICDPPGLSWSGSFDSQLPMEDAKTRSPKPKMTGITFMP
jgi:hypothetical protein